METKQVFISPPNFQVARFLIRGNAPYVQNKFSKKATEEIKRKQAAGPTAKKGTKREPKDFNDLFLQSLHRSTEGWYGIPAPAFRNALVSACRTVGFQMTKAKLSVFILADGIDPDDGTPLVKITKGEPQYAEHMVRIQQTVDLRVRGLWQPGWEAVVNVRYDADQFTGEDIANLMMRVGVQVGIGEGRPDSKQSTGMDWGTFNIIGGESE